MTEFLMELKTDMGKYLWLLNQGRAQRFDQTESGDFERTRLYVEKCIDRRITMQEHEANLCDCGNPQHTVAKWAEDFFEGQVLCDEQNRAAFLNASRRT